MKHSNTKRTAITNRLSEMAGSLAIVATMASPAIISLAQYVSIVGGK
jgi:hypothetical protein